MKKKQLFNQNGMIKLMRKDNTISFTLCIHETSKRGPFTNSEDSDEMLYNAAFHLDLHCLLK